MRATIKLITADIDGMLVPDGGDTVGPEIYDVVLRLWEKGIQFATASGRQWASIEALFGPIKEKIFYLSDNGTYLGCHGRNPFLNRTEQPLIMEMVEAVRKTPGLKVMASGPDVVYVDTKDKELVDWMVHGCKLRMKHVNDLLDVEDDFIKFSVYKKKDVQAATEELQEIYGDRLEMTILGDMWMDCMAPGVCKRQAIEILQGSLEIRPEETMAFGDQLNDIEMLQKAYYSFAVGNARPKVKQTARFRADTNVNDGVLKILEELL